MGVAVWPLTRRMFPVLPTQSDVGAPVSPGAGTQFFLAGSPTPDSTMSRWPSGPMSRCLGLLRPLTRTLMWTLGAA